MYDCVVKYLYRHDHEKFENFIRMPRRMFNHIVTNVTPLLEKQTTRMR